MAGNSFKIDRLGKCRFKSPLPDAFFIADDSAILVDATLKGYGQCTGNPSVLEAAGPRKKLFFRPETVCAAVVTCGGLCPGLNDVIRGITMVLWHEYGVRKILGIRYGYEGLVEGSGHNPLRLTPEKVEDIHQDGGTILGSSRGPQSIEAMVDFIERKGINMLFTIGGDGTQRGALEITKEIKRRRRQVTVVGIPKTIDNDICYTERTFGFETAVAMSRVPITCAHMEAKGARNGVGIVKLMGRESGFVAAYATLASSDVNLVLVPEVPFSLEKVISFLKSRLQRKRHAVIVVAEGAGQDLVGTNETDASGNRKLGDIGVFLRDTISRTFKEMGFPCTVRYIDPSYTIRSAPAEADDSVFCFRLAENAVHAAMSGRTGMIVGLWNGSFVHVPMEKAVSKRKRIDPNGPLWRSVLDNTGQPWKLC